MRILLYSVMAGVCGTGLGGLITVLLGAKSDKASCMFLSFAGGIMTGMVAFGLIPESLDTGGMRLTLAGLAAGLAAILLLNYAVDRMTGAGDRERGLHGTPGEMYHAQNLMIGGGRNMLRSGIVMLTAIGLHNIPEGLAIGAAGSHDLRLGLSLAIIIALHDIPEGMAVAAPLLAGGMSKVKAALLTTLSGAPTVAGAALGMLFGNISDAAVAFSIAFAGGAMLYVVFGEIIPQAVTMQKSRVPAVVTMAGFVVGLLMTNICE